MRRHGSVVIGPPPEPNRRQWPFVGTVDFQGIPVHVENLPGSVRSGVDVDGHPWQTRMTAIYGEIAGTEGNDGDGVDVFVGRDADAPTAYVVHQKRPGTQVFDEDKVVLGCRTLEAARELYLAHYDQPGWWGGATPWPVAELADYVRKRKRTPRLDRPRRVLVRMGKLRKADLPLPFRNHDDVRFANQAGYALIPSSRDPRVRRWHRMMERPRTPKDAPVSRPALFASGPGWQAPTDSDVAGSLLAQAVGVTAGHEVAQLMREFKRARDLAAEWAGGNLKMTFDAPAEYGKYASWWRSLPKGSPAAVMLGTRQWLPHHVGLKPLRPAEAALSGPKLFDILAKRAKIARAAFEAAVVPPIEAGETGQREVRRKVHGLLSDLADDAMAARGAVVLRSLGAQIEEVDAIAAMRDALYLAEEVEREQVWLPHWGSATADNKLAQYLSSVLGSVYRPLPDMRPVPAPSGWGKGRRVEYMAIALRAQRHMASTLDSVPHLYRGMRLPVAHLRWMQRGEVTEIPLTGMTAFTALPHVADHYLGSSWTAARSERGAVPVKIIVNRSYDAERLWSGVNPSGTKLKPGDPPYEVTTAAERLEIKSVEPPRFDVVLDIDHRVGGNTVSRSEPFGIRELGLSDDEVDAIVAHAVAWEGDDTVRDVEQVAPALLSEDWRGHLQRQRQDLANGKIRVRRAYIEDRRGIYWRVTGELSQYPIAPQPGPVRPAPKRAEVPLVPTPPMARPPAPASPQLSLVKGRVMVRSKIANQPGMILAPSKATPTVRRWQQTVPRRGRPPEQPPPPDWVRPPDSSLLADPRLVYARDMVAAAERSAMEDYGVERQYSAKTKEDLAALLVRWGEAQRAVARQIPGSDDDALRSTEESIDKFDELLAAVPVPSRELAEPEFAAQFEAYKRAVKRVRAPTGLATPDATFARKQRVRWALHEWFDRQWQRAGGEYEGVRTLESYARNAKRAPVDPTGRTQWLPHWGSATGSNVRARRLCAVVGSVYRPLPAMKPVHWTKPTDADRATVATARRHMATVAQPEVWRGLHLESSVLAALYVGDKIPLTGMTAFTALPHVADHYMTSHWTTVRSSKTSQPAKMIARRDDASELLWSGVNPSGARLKPGDPPYEVTTAAERFVVERVEPPSGDRFYWLIVGRLTSDRAEQVLGRRHRTGRLVAPARGRLAQRLRKSARPRLFVVAKAMQPSLFTGQIANQPGFVLKPSSADPRVRRWQRVNPPQVVDAAGNRTPVTVEKYTPTSLADDFATFVLYNDRYVSELFPLEMGEHKDRRWGALVRELHGRYHEQAKELLKVTAPHALRQEVAVALLQLAYDTAHPGNRAPWYTDPDLEGEAGNANMVRLGEDAKTLLQAQVAASRGAAFVADLNAAHVAATGAPAEALAPLLTAVEANDSRTPRILAVAIDSYIEREQHRRRYAALVDEVDAALPDTLRGVLFARSGRVAAFVDALAADRRAGDEKELPHWGSATADNALARQLAATAGSEYRPLPAMEAIDNVLSAAQLEKAQGFRAYAQRRASETPREEWPELYRGMMLPAQVAEWLARGEVDEIPLTGMTSFTFERRVAEYYASSQWTREKSVDGSRSAVLVMARSQQTDDLLTGWMENHPSRWVFSPWQDHPAGPAYEVTTAAERFVVDRVVDPSENVRVRWWTTDGQSRQTVFTPSDPEHAALAAAVTRVPTRGHRYGDPINDALAELNREAEHTAAVAALSARAARTGVPHDHRGDRVQVGRDEGPIEIHGVAVQYERAERPEVQRERQQRRRLEAFRQRGAPSEGARGRAGGGARDGAAADPAAVRAGGPRGGQLGLAELGKAAGVTRILVRRGK